MTFPFIAKANGDTVKAVSQVVNVIFDVLHLCIMLSRRMVADTDVHLLSSYQFCIMSFNVVLLAGLCIKVKTKGICCSM